MKPTLIALNSAEFFERCEPIGTARFVTSQFPRTYACAASAVPTSTTAEEDES